MLTYALTMQEVADAIAAHIGKTKSDELPAGTLDVVVTLLPESVVADVVAIVEVAPLKPAVGGLIA